MKIGTSTTRFPARRRKKAFGMNRLSAVRSKSRLPSARAAGTAGGVLLGAGAAVAAGRAAHRRGDRQEDGTAEAESAEPRDDRDADADADENGEPRKRLLDRLKESAPAKGGGAGKVKVTNIEEHIDIGASRRLVYDQWTLFQDYPSFMKKVVSVDQAADEKLDWKAKVLWSSRKWESTIVEQVPDRHIIWRSTGDKGHVDGAVSFHKLAPNLTRVLLVLEYHPQGFLERTGNLWRAQGRRVRLELKHFRRHVMTQSLLHPDEVGGWRGEIRDSQVVKTHEQATAEEEKAGGEKEEHQYQEAR
jgi:uncharacterized membrane protein